MKAGWITVAATTLSLTFVSAAGETDLAPGADVAPLPTATEAYLSKARVKLTVTYRNPYTGEAGTAMAVPQGDELAFFAFSSPSNPEVFVKVLGGNDPSWLQLFAAGLTTFEYTVTFSGCGQTKSWRKEAYARTTFDDGAGLPIAGCPPWSDETTVTLPGGVPLALVKIPAGTFQMGSPTTERSRLRNETLHTVTLTDDYYVAKYPVTQGQWLAVMGTPMSAACAIFGVGATHPVHCVSWDDVRGASGFLDRLNAYLASTGQAGAGKFRLPTEAEWERAARGGTETRFSFGDALAGDDSCGANAEASPYVWWCGNNTPSGTKPVGTKLANPYGLFDMHGSVLEWVEDLYGSYPAGPVTDPKGPSTGSNRVFRGGSWNGDLDYCRSAARFADRPSFPFWGYGFRLARSL